MPRNGKLASQEQRYKCKLRTKKINGRRRPPEGAALKDTTTIKHAQLELTPLTTASRDTCTLSPLSSFPSLFLHVSECPHFSTFCRIYKRSLKKPTPIKMVKPYQRYQSQGHVKTSYRCSKFNAYCLLSCWKKKKLGCSC